MSLSSSGTCTFRMRRPFVEQQPHAATTIRVPVLDEREWDNGVPGQSFDWGAQSWNTSRLWVHKYRISSQHSFRPGGQGPVCLHLGEPFDWGLSVQRPHP